jgi:hypothetical protein
MKTEIIITDEAALEAINLINDYLFKGGTGFDNEKLESVCLALSAADQIVIMPMGEQQ